MSASRGACQDCKHYAALANQCRVNPPSPAVVPGPIGAPIIIGMFPAVAKDQWCGRFEAKRLADRMVN